MRLPDEVRERFRRYGSSGGQARARNLSSARRRSVAQRAALRRWIAVRFGNPSFSAGGLPGGAMIDAGLDALVDGRETVESLAVSLAASRLRREGVPLPAVVHADADRRLYRLLEMRNEELAHARYLACLGQVASFADACRAVRRPEGSRSRHRGHHAR